MKEETILMGKKVSEVSVPYFRNALLCSQFLNTTFPVNGKYYYVLFDDGHIYCDIIFSNDREGNNIITDLRMDPSTDDEYKLYHKINKSVWGMSVGCRLT